MDSTVTGPYMASRPVYGLTALYMATRPCIWLHGPVYHWFMPHGPVYHWFMPHDPVYTPWPCIYNMASSTTWPVQQHGRMSTWPDVNMAGMSGYGQMSGYDCQC